MTCSCVKTCPNCGMDLKTFDHFKLGSLEILYNSIVLWQGKRVDLTPTQVLIVGALARAKGAQVREGALLEAIGSTSDNSSGLLATHMSHIRSRFRARDRHFDAIKRGWGMAASGLTWWQTDEDLLSILGALRGKTRQVHKALLLHPGSSIVELTALLGLKSHGSVSQALKRLLEAGLVRREKQYQRGYTALGTLDLHRQLGDTKWQQLEPSSTNPAEASCSASSGEPISAPSMREAA